MEKKKSKKDKMDKATKVKLVVIIIIILLILWFIVLSPILTFKRNEKVVLDATKRYYEINSGQLPTGNRIKEVTLTTLYQKKFIENDIRSPYTGKVCDIKSSWVKVRQESGEYKYYVYLDCGILKSKVDHQGPVIKLKGEETITINKGDKFDDPGIASVKDNTDGSMDVSKVEVVNNVNSNKIGTYQVTYTIRDSFNNETEKVRTVKVIETLNHIVEKDTNGTKVYKGDQENNYVQLDGITFKIVGINDDDTVKLVTDSNISAIDYSHAEEWLNNYFYNKFSDSAKNLIVKSKWCDEEVSDGTNYTKCNHYGKKANVGILSIADINNSKGEDNSYNINNNSLLANKKDSKTVWKFLYQKYTETAIGENVVISPAVNIKKYTKVIKGNGSAYNPYILQGNKYSAKAGTKVSETRVGDYINYSGYRWRVIGKEDDGTTQIIMNGVVKNSEADDYVKFSENNNLNYNPSKKNNIGYYIINNTASYVKTGVFEKKKLEVLDYTKNITYNANSKKNSYNVKITIPSMYDLFSSSISFADYWYKDYSSKTKKYCYNSSGQVVCEDYDYNEINGIRLVGYLKSSVEVKSGSGASISPYTISN